MTSLTRFGMIVFFTAYALNYFFPAIPYLPLITAIGAGIASVGLILQK